MVSKERVIEIVRKKEVADGLDQYIFFQKSLYTDIANNQEYQERFRHFYQMRKQFYSNEFVKYFFDTFQALKNQIQHQRKR